jgi:hypothetical protein
MQPAMVSAARRDRAKIFSLHVRQEILRRRLRVNNADPATMQMAHEPYDR